MESEGEVGESWGVREPSEEPASIYPGEKASRADGLEKVVQDFLRDLMADLMWQVRVLAL